MTTITTTRQLDSENPWPGLESFEENAHDFFFGRDREAESLLNHVRDASVTILYGRSGLGKTSLLRAGLFPALREENFLPIYVRLELQQGSAALSRQLHQSVYDSIQANVSDALLPADDESLWEYLHRKDFELWSTQNYPLTPVIVLDQFEELFTLGERVPELVREFMNHFGDLAENRIPADVAARIDNDEAEAARFQLRSHNYKLLITLREDFLPHLEEWCPLIPALGRSRVRLLPLNADTAFAAVHKPAAHLMTGDLAERVVRIVAGEDLNRGRDGTSANVDRGGDGLGASSVEPALLSLFCRELNEERKRHGQQQFDEQLVEDAKRDILSNYYSSCVHDLPARVAEFIESELITEKGFRDSYAREDAVPSRLTKEELARLISSRLLRLEEYHGAQRIELTHDVLTGVVREHRDRRRAEAEKAALAARAEQEKEALAKAAERHAAELDRERRVGRRFRKLSAALALVCVAAVVLAMVAFFNWRSATAARNAADAASRNTKAEWLYGNSQLMLAGQSPHGSEDVTAMQMALAAHALRSTDDTRNYELLTALNQEPDLLKVIDMPTPLESVAFSPDGSRIASGSDDGTVRLWDADSGESIVQPLRGHTDDWVSSVAFSPDGSRVASAGVDKTVRLWDVDSGESIGQPLRGHTVAAIGLAFSPDGSRIASASGDKTVRLWDADSGEPIGQPLLGHTDWVRSVAFSPDGSRIVSGGDDKTVRLWDAVTGQPVGEPLNHEGWVRSVAFSPDGGRIVSGGDDKTVRLWDAVTGQPIGKPMDHDNTVTIVAFSPDGARIVTSGAGKTIQLWDATTQQEAGVFVGHQSGVTAAAFTSDGQRLVSSSGDGTVRIWDAISWQPMHVEGEGPVAWFSPDGRRIYSGSTDGTVRRWDSITKRPIEPPLRVDGDVDGLFPFGEDKLLSLKSDDQGTTHVLVWDADSLRQVSPDLQVTTHRVAWTDNGDRIVAGTAQDVLQIFDAGTSRPIGAPIKHGAAVTTFDMTSNGRFVVTGGADNTARLWDGRTGTSLSKPMKGDDVVGAVAVSSDGSRLAAGYLDFTLRVWDTATGELIGEPMDTRSVTNAIAFSPDGRIVASGGGDGTIRLWDASNQTQLGAAYKDHSRFVGSLYFNNDGTKLVSASPDQTVRVWPVPSLSPDAARDALCAKLTHNMASEQWDELVDGEIDYVEGCPDLPEAEDGE